MNKLFILVGLQASGKSTYARDKQCEFGSGNYPAVIISADDIRLKFPEWTPNQVWSHLYGQVNAELKYRNVILDNTNVTIKNRKMLLDAVTIPCEKHIKIMNTPYEECLKRLEERNNSEYPTKIGKEVLDKYIRIFQVPFMEEGWTSIELINKKSINVKQVKELQETLNNFDQNNKHHTQTLGVHSEAVLDQLKLMKEVGDMAGTDVFFGDTSFLTGCVLHDIGKLFVRHPNPKNPEMSSYYNHAEFGAYWKLCNGWSIEEAFWENYHMLLMSDASDKTKEKLKKQFGEQKFFLLSTLREADGGAH